MNSTLIKRRYQFILNLLAWGFVFFLAAPTVIEVTDDFIRRRSLSNDAETFHKACVEGRAAAITKGNAVGVEFGGTSWMVFEDVHAPIGQKDRKDKVFRSGTWNADTKLGSNIPNGRFYFSEDGVCRINLDTICEKENLQAPDAVAHIIAFASDAPRIYTLFFDELGEPRIEYDDF